MYVADAQTRIRAGDAQTTHKMVGGVTLVGGNGSELTRLPGGAELNILPANGNALHWISFVLFLLYLYRSLNTLIFSIFATRGQTYSSNFSLVIAYLSVSIKASSDLISSRFSYTALHPRQNRTALRSCTEKRC